MFCYHYAGKTSGPRYDIWREEFGRRWIAVDFQPVGQDYVAYDMRGTQHSFLALCTMRGTPVHMDRRDNQARGYACLILASDSRLQACQRGRSIDLSKGQMILMSADEPARLTQLTEGSRWSIRIPQKLLSDFCRNLDDKITRPIVSSELTKLLLHQIETAQRFGPNLDASANHATAQYVLDLVGLCLGANSDAAHIAERRGLAAARLDAVKAELLAGLGRSELGLAHIAARHGISTRYVQHLFEMCGTSFTAFVLEQRLLLAHRLLREPKSRRCKISDIAAAAGFSDISYFNRAFRARFGGTPKDIRASLDQGQGKPDVSEAAANELPHDGSQQS
jgi:AraC-like DNA-binding protein